jgi:DNA-directed RNA polymerase subunit RPC12/RpoP
MQTVVFVIFGLLLLYIIALQYALIKGVAIMHERLSLFRPPLATPAEPEKKSPWRSGTEYVFTPIGGTRVAKCDNCSHKYIVENTPMVDETCPECGHTNIPF